MSELDRDPPGAPRAGQEMTFEEAARLDPDEHQGELDAGRWTPVTRGTWRHGTIVVNVCAMLKQYARQHPGWSIAAADPGTRLGHDPPVLRGPDVAVIRAEREPRGRGEDGWLDGAPDLAIEVLGDSQSVSKLMRKALEYLAAGARAVWLIDPEPQEVIVVEPPDHVRVLGRDQLLAGGEVLPGFECVVRELFE